MISSFLLRNKIDFLNAIFERNTFNYKLLTIIIYLYLLFLIHRSRIVGWYGIRIFVFGISNYQIQTGSQAAPRVERIRRHLLHHWTNIIYIFRLRGFWHPRYRLADYAVSIFTTWTFNKDHKPTSRPITSLIIRCTIFIYSQNQFDG